ncbi:hypothetical protein WAI453_012535 [Rhynchosporium graminicola]
MNEAMAPDDEVAAGFRIVEPKELLSRSLSTLKEEINTAAKTGQAVVVLVFGHGEEDTSSVYIGCAEKGHWLLNQAMLGSVLREDVPTTLIFTSCYSGGWLMKPNANENFLVKPLFNHNFFTAADKELESLSWPVSKTIGRQAGGSPFATMLAASIMIASKEVQKSDDRGRLTGSTHTTLTKIEEDDEGQRLSLTMVGLVEKIKSELQSRNVTNFAAHVFSFAAKDDLWAETWGARIGLPLLDYEARWNRLPEAEVKKEFYSTSKAHTGSVKSAFTSSKSYSWHIRAIQAKAKLYMASKPGLDNAGGNTSCHPLFYDLIAGKKLTFEELQEVDDTLDYRLHQVDLAETFCRVLKLGMSDDERASKFHQAEWRETQFNDQNGEIPERAKRAQELLSRFTTIKGWITKLNLFDSPIAGQGFDYSKPSHYLSARLAESSMSTSEIYGKLEAIQQWKLRRLQLVADSPLGRAVLDQPEIRTMRQRIYGTAATLKHRLRSLSPSKRAVTRQRQGLPQFSSQG